MATSSPIRRRCRAEKLRNQEQESPEIPDVVKTPFPRKLAGRRHPVAAITGSSHMPEPAAHDLFDGASRAVLSRFGYTVLAPIVKIFMRFGWSARDFSDLARWVFVKVFYATPEFWRHGRPTALQGAIKTGLPRQQVKVLNDIPEPQLA